MKQLLTALDYSHKQGVVHRDIKPANLMILPGPKVKIMDFGIARLESSSLTQVGTVVGTPTHMAPEQLMGVPADGRADLWAAGVILYELLTGVSPFLAETPAAVMHRVLQVDARAALGDRTRRCPAGFDAVVARALAKKPDERFQSAREFQAGAAAGAAGQAPRAAASLPIPSAPCRPEAARAEATRTSLRAAARGGRSRSPPEVARRDRALALAPHRPARRGAGEAEPGRGRGHR